MAAIFHLSKQEEEGEGLYEHKDNVGEKASRSLSLSLLSPFPQDPFSKGYTL
jgi:hypothetical protein